MTQEDHSSAAAPVVVTTSSLAAGAALRIVSSAVGFAAIHRWRIAVVVVDPHGVTLAAARMDGVAPPVLDFAQDKAFTAATMRRTTQAFFERMDGSPSLRLGLSNRERLMVWGGGLPAVIEGQVVGGIGVSGAKDVEDIACAEAALSGEGLGWEL